MFHGGDLDFKEEELTRILHVLDQVPTIVDIYLDRPAVIPEIAEKSAALLDVVFGRAAPQGTLPFELPSSMDVVRQQKEDVVQRPGIGDVVEPEVHEGDQLGHGARLAGERIQHRPCRGGL